MASSAIASKFGGIVRPSAFTALRLRISSNLVGRMTGRSAKRTSVGATAMSALGQKETRPYL
jgi:hypothetical protein